MDNKGGLTVIIAPMFGGKTSEIYREVDRRSYYAKCLCVNHVSDNRYSDSGLATHSGIKFPGIRVSKLEELRNKTQYIEADVVAIDEGAFFEDLDSFVREQLETTNKRFIVSSLNGDSEQKMFGKVYYLIPLADDVKFLKAICSKCMDGTKASFTICNVKKTGKILVGSSQYQSVCRKHLLEHNQKKNNK